MSTSLKLLSTLAVMGAMPELVSRYEKSSGSKITAEFGTTNEFVPRVRAGEPADVGILTTQAVEELAANGVFAAGSAVHLATSVVGLAVKAGARKPDISSVEAFKSALLAARSICYSRMGASGVFFAGLIEQLGIADEVRAKAKIKPNGFTAELAASGEVEIAVQQISELMAVPGIEVVGPLPAQIQSVTGFSGAVFSGSTQPEAARRFLQFLSSAQAKAVLGASGLQP